MRDGILCLFHLLWFSVIGHNKIVLAATLAAVNEAEYVIDSNGEAKEVGESRYLDGEPQAPHITRKAQRISPSERLSLAVDADAKSTNVRTLGSVTSGGGSVVRRKEEKVDESQKASFYERLSNYMFLLTEVDSGRAPMSLLQGEPVESGDCKSGPRFGIELLLLSFCVFCLMVKWLTERPRRRFLVFSLDVLKQIIGLIVLRVTTVISAAVFKKAMKEGGACSFYWLGLLVDDTFGLFICWMLLRFTEWLVGYTSGKYSRSRLLRRVASRLPSRVSVLEEDLAWQLNPDMLEWTVQLSAWCKIVFLQRGVTSFLLILAFTRFNSQALAFEKRVDSDRLLFLMLACINAVRVVLMDTLLKYKDYKDMPRNSSKAKSYMDKSLRGSKKSSKPAKLPADLTQQKQQKKKDPEAELDARFEAATEAVEEFLLNRATIFTSATSLFQRTPSNAAASGRRSSFFSRDDEAPGEGRRGSLPFGLGKGGIFGDGGVKDRLLLQALHQQATSGDVSGDKPGITEPNARASYLAWQRLKGTSKEDAKRQYIGIAERIAPGEWQNQADDSDGESDAPNAVITSAPTLDELFQAAQHALKGPHSEGKIGNEDKLALYSSFKQATVGDVTGTRPGAFEMVARYKFDSWAKLKGMDTDAAKQKYCDLADKYAPADWKRTFVVTVREMNGTLSETASTAASTNGEQHDDGEVHDLHTMFLAAQYALKGPHSEGKIGNEDKLLLFSHFKQATEGDVKGDRPGAVEQVQRYKWDYWAKLRGMSAETAKRKYCEFADRLASPDWRQTWPNQVKELPTASATGSPSTVSSPRPSTTIAADKVEVSPQTTDTKETTLEDLFVAAQLSMKVPYDQGKLSNEDKLLLYSHFKQATDGDVTGDRPGVESVGPRYKYDFWAKLRGMDSDTAKRKYCDLADKHVPNWRENLSTTSEESK